MLFRLCLGRDILPPHFFFFFFFFHFVFLSFFAFFIHPRRVPMIIGHSTGYAPVSSRTLTGLFLSVTPFQIPAVLLTDE